MQSDRGDCRYAASFFFLFVSVFFGASVGTVLAVIVIPLGCITMRRRFYMVETETGEIELSQRYFETEVGAIETPVLDLTRVQCTLSIPVGLVLFLLGIGVDQFFTPFPLLRGLGNLVWSSSNSATGFTLCWLTPTTRTRPPVRT